MKSRAAVAFEKAKPLEIVEVDLEGDITATSSQVDDGPVAIAQFAGLDEWIEHRDTSLRR